MLHFLAPLLPWIPFIGLFGLLVKVYLHARRAFKNARLQVMAYADTLLGNHMKHIQEAVEISATSLQEITKTNAQMVGALSQMHTDIKMQHQELSRTQASILTGIEVIRAKLD